MFGLEDTVLFGRVLLTQANMRSAVMQADQALNEVPAPPKAAWYDGVTATGAAAHTFTVAPSTTTRCKGRWARRRSRSRVAEVRRIAHRLGRDPTLVELYAFDAQWSEHCSYKSSRHILRRLPGRRADRHARAGRRCRRAASRRVERRALRRRGRARVAQPSLASRAVRRRGDRHRRDRARRAVHGREGDRRRRSAALRAARRTAALPLRRAERRRRHRRLRQRDRRAEHRRRRVLRRGVRRQLSGQRRRARARQRRRDRALACAPKARPDGTSCSSARRPIPAASAARRSRR